MNKKMICAIIVSVLIVSSIVIAQDDKTTAPEPTSPTAGGGTPTTPTAPTTTTPPTTPGTPPNLVVANNGQTVYRYNPTTQRAQRAFKINGDYSTWRTLSEDSVSDRESWETYIAARGGGQGYYVQHGQYDNPNTPAGQILGRGISQGQVRKATPVTPSSDITPPGLTDAEKEELDTTNTAIEKAKEDFPENGAALTFLNHILGEDELDTAKQRLEFLKGAAQSPYVEAYTTAVLDARQRESEAKKKLANGDITQEQFDAVQQESNSAIVQATEELQKQLKYEKAVAMKKTNYANVWAKGVETAAGWSGLSSAIEDKEYLKFMDVWHNAVDTVLSVIIPTVESTTSRLCKVRLRKSGPAGNILYTESGGQPITSVFANGERSTLVHPNGTAEHLYKLSYYVRIPDIAGTTPLGETVTQTRTGERRIDGYYNVFVVDADGKRYPLYVNPENFAQQSNLPIEDGVSALLTSMKVFYSKRLYDRIRIEFYKHKQDVNANLRIPFAGKERKSFTNPIIGVSIAAPAPGGASPPPTTAPITASDGSSAVLNPDL